MFGKSKISQSMIDAVNSVVEGTTEVKVEEIKEVQMLEESSEKVATPTGMKVYGSSYGNSKKARQDQTKSPIDALKNPKDKEMKEELKGNQHKIDANKNNKIDSQDFEILRGKKKVKEDITFAEKLIEKVKAKMQEKKDVVMPEEVRKSDVPAYLRKAKGDTPLTVADVKAPKKDTISAPENLAKARNEEVEQIEEKHMTDADKAEQERIVKGMKKNLSGFKARYGDKAKSVMYATATKQAMKEDAVEEATIAGTPGWEKMKKDVKDKSGAVHTPMSRARDLARSAFNKVQDKTKITK